MSSEQSIAERKKALSQDTEKYKQAIGNQVDGLKENAGQVGKMALIVGGSLAASYLLVRTVVRARRKKRHKYENGGIDQQWAKNPQPRRESVIMSTIKHQLTMFLVGLAKQRIQAIIDHSRNNDKTTTTEKQHFNNVNQ